MASAMSGAFALRLGSPSSTNTKIVEYEYASSRTPTTSVAGKNYSRQHKLHYPDQSWVQATYGSSKSTRDLISRPTRLTSNWAGTTGSSKDLVDYRYLGLGMVATVQYGASNGSGGGNVILDRSYAHHGERLGGPGSGRSGGGGVTGYYYAGTASGATACWRG
jgi:hypothetical protein